MSEAPSNPPKNAMTMTREEYEKAKKELLRGITHDRLSAAADRNAQRAMQRYQGR